MDEKEYEFCFYEFQKREDSYRHVSYKQEMHPFMLMKEGDFAGVEEAERELKDTENYGIISRNPLQNLKYVCVAGIAIATRIAIETGLEEQFSYNISDFYASVMK